MLSKVTYNASQIGLDFRRVDNEKFKKMETQEILNKINKIVDDFEKQKAEQKVLVMHPTAMIMVKDKITRYHDINNTRESFVFDGKITVFPSFYLPINHFAFMTNAEYEEHYKPKN